MFLRNIDARLELLSPKVSVLRPKFLMTVSRMCTPVDQLSITTKAPQCDRIMH